MAMTTGIYDLGLDKNAASYVQLTPLTFIERAAFVYPDHTAVIYREVRRSWSETDARCRRLASALARRGIGAGQTVAVLSANLPEMFECHFGVPMAGAVLNTINIRLDAEAIAFVLQHGEASALIVDPEFSEVAARALKMLEGRPLVVDIIDRHFPGGKRIGQLSYDELLDEGNSDFTWEGPADEWQAISLNYTSGTTGNPKGVVYHHRGAYLNAISNILTWNMSQHPVYLWTLPMFHCNGWCFPWTVAARAGVNVCLRKVEAKAMVDAIREHDVTHYCGAPIVHGMLVNAPAELKQGLPRGVKAMVAGAAPPASLIEGMETLGFDLTHVYGLTEVYGPATVCPKHDEWNEMDIGERPRLIARHGGRYHLHRDARVIDPQTMKPVPMDGETMGEIMFRGN